MKNFYIKYWKKSIRLLFRTKRLVNEKEDRSEIESIISVLY